MKVRDTKKRAQRHVKIELRMRTCRPGRGEGANVNKETRNKDDKGIISDSLCSGSLWHSKITKTAILGKTFVIFLLKRAPILVITSFGVPSISIN